MGDEGEPGEPRKRCSESGWDSETIFVLTVQTGRLLTYDDCLWRHRRESSLESCGDSSRRGRLIGGLFSVDSEVSLSDRAVPGGVEEDQTWGSSGEVIQEVEEDCRGAFGCAHEGNVESTRTGFAAKGSLSCPLSLSSLLTFRLRWFNEGMGPSCAGSKSIGGRGG